MAKFRHPKDHSTDRIGDVLDQSLKRLDLAQQLEAYGIWPVWNDVVGKPVARNAQPEKIRNGTLFVKVSSPVWMQQLQFMKDLIAEKLNQRLRADIVKNIFFVVGGKAIITDGQADDKRADTKTMTEVDVKLDDRFLDFVPDPETRQALKKLLRSYARHKQKP